MSGVQEQDAGRTPFYGNVRPLLNEVLHAIDRLLDTGEPTTIDLAGLPFGPGELEQLEATLGEPESVNAIWKPQNGVPVGEDKAGTLLKLVDALEDDDDAQNVYANFEIDDEVMASLG